MQIGMLGIYRLLFVFLFVCLSTGFLVTDISSVFWHRAMKFGRMVELVATRSSPLLVNFWPRR